MSFPWEERRKLGVLVGKKRENFDHLSWHWRSVSSKNVSSKRAYNNYDNTVTMRRENICTDVLPQRNYKRNCDVLIT